MPKDLPIDFRLTLLKNAPNPLGVLRSKGKGVHLNAREGLKSINPHYNTSWNILH